jgi:hypothetical protein
VSRVTVAAEEVVVNSTRLGWLLVVIGLIVLAVSALADPIGVGADGDGSGFGWKQATGVVVGGLVAAAGSLVLWRDRTGTTSAQPE